MAYARLMPVAARRTWLSMRGQLVPCVGPEAEIAAMTLPSTMTGAATQDSPKVPSSRS
jgi:hypothetical protein